MKSSPKQKIIEALKDQQAIFGDDLFEEKANLTKSKTAAPAKEIITKRIITQNHSCKRTNCKTISI